MGELWKSEYHLRKAAELEGLGLRHATQEVVLHLKVNFPTKGTTIRFLSKPIKAGPADICAVLGLPSTAQLSADKTRPDKRPTLLRPCRYAAREVCLRFVKLDLVLDCYVIANNYAFCNLIRAFRSGSYPAPFDKKSRSEHQTLFLARAERLWARD